HGEGERDVDEKDAVPGEGLEQRPGAQRADRQSDAGDRDPDADRHERVHRERASWRPVTSWARTSAATATSPRAELRHATSTLLPLRRQTETGRSPARIA